MMKKKSGLSPELPGNTKSWKPMLEAIPIQNQAARVLSEGDTGEVCIYVPTKPDWWYKIPPICWIVRPPKERQLILDSIGSSVWALCDGNRSVENIIDLFGKKFSLTFHESRVSVTSYLKLLIERGALAISL